MPDEPQTEQSDSQIDGTDDPYTRPISVGLVVVAVALFIAGLAILGIVAHYRVGEHSERIRFFTDSSLNLLILVAILVQAYIYVRQWAVMEHHGKAMRGQLDVMQKSLLHTMKVNVGQINYWTAQQKAMDSQADTMQGQLAVMRDTLAQSVFTANEIAAATLKQLQLMKEQAKTMDRQLVLGTRAYVGVKELIADYRMRKIHLYIENVGKVPANNIQVVMELAILIPRNLATPRQWEGGGDDPDVWRLLVPFIFAYGKRTKLFPGKTLDVITFIEPYHLSRDQIILMESKDPKIRSRIRGEVRYFDGFHKDKITYYDFVYLGGEWLPQRIDPDNIVRPYGEPEPPDEDDYQPS